MQRCAAGNVGGQSWRLLKSPKGRLSVHGAKGHAGRGSVGVLGIKITPVHHVKVQGRSFLDKIIHTPC